MAQAGAPRNIGGSNDGNGAVPRTRPPVAMRQVPSTGPSDDDATSASSIRSEVALCIVMVAIIAVMLLPMPAFLLDLLLSLSISLSLVMFLFAMHIDKPLQFSAFPSLLLLTTLGRLALNIASTRRILLHGSEGTDAAGRVIEAFGQFVVGGNLVVGVIIYLILIVINFVVITKGSGRISEVAARFTLDSMPGKQMAIDADLAAGQCDEKEARRRRRAVEQEADFFGAMDGAAKFVRGDAVAGLLITGVNIVGGLVIGIAQQHMQVISSLKYLHQFDGWRWFNLTNTKLVDVHCRRSCYHPCGSRCAAWQSGWRATLWHPKHPYHNCRCIGGARFGARDAALVLSYSCGTVCGWLDRYTAHQKERGHNGCAII